MTETLEEKTLPKQRFNGKIARDLRIKAGLSQLKLSGVLCKRVEEITPSGDHYPLGIRSLGKLIGRFEKGEPNKHPKESRAAMLYLSWLQEEGYNPYNL